jgi:type IV secretory pathway protease TraF
VKNAKRAYIRKGLAILLLSLVTAITINNVVYLHSHVIDQGVVITHAHPFDKSADNLPFKSHKHTNFEYTITQGFGLFLLSSVLALTFFTIVKKVQYYQFTERLNKIVPTKPTQRGPPSYSLV